MVSLGELYQRVLINQDGSEYNLAHPLLYMGQGWVQGSKVQRFRVQGSILVAGLHLGKRVFFSEGFRSLFNAFFVLNPLAQI